MTAASFKYGQKVRKCSGRNIKNADGFKNIGDEHTYGRFGYRQNLPVCNKNHDSGIPSGTP
ncbi:hypothetical protein AN666_26555 [Enterobacter hormaechei]|nr:hypothetical protein AN666_26555 [Enterobacter hormaechei]